MNPNTSLFGTDGIRGRVGEYPIVPDFALHLGWAIGLVLREAEVQPQVLISKDTRLSGYLFESALEAGLIAAGAEVFQLGPMPTPAVAYLTKSLRAAAGIVISASHNRFEDNGFKFFNADGTKFSKAWEERVIELLETPVKMVASKDIGRAHRLSDVHGRYIEYCKSTFSRKHTLRGVKMVLDCANGATYQVAPTLFKELGAEVIAIHDKPNGMNINENCGSTEPASLIEAVLTHKADVGIAFDGDGDRVVMVDHTGQLLDGDHILYILAQSYQDKGLLSGGVVGTQMSNLGLELALRDRAIDFIRTRVGDKYVLSALTERKWNLGGETSGHIICLDHANTGDGLISALQVLQVCCEKDAPLHQLTEGMQKLAQVLLNVKTKHNAILSQPQFEAAVLASEAQLQGRGRIVVRASGTEPVIRVMVEGEDVNLIQSVAKSLAALIEQGG